MPGEPVRWLLANIWLTGLPRVDLLRVGGPGIAFMPERVGCGTAVTASTSASQSTDKSGVARVGEPRPNVGHGA